MISSRLSHEKAWTGRGYRLRRARRGHQPRTAIRDGSLLLEPCGGEIRAEISEDGRIKPQQGPVQGGSEAHPGQVRYEQECSQAVQPPECPDGRGNEQPE